MPKHGTKVHNFLEDSNYITSTERPIVLCGTACEMWIIDFSKFASTYIMADGHTITKETLQSMMKQVN